MSAKESTISRVVKLITNLNRNGLRFKNAGYGDVFQQKVADIQTKFPVKRVASGLSKSKVELREFSLRELRALEKTLEKTTSKSESNTVVQYKKSLLKKDLLIRTVNNLTGNALQGMDESTKVKYLHSLLKQLGGRVKIYSSTQVIAEYNNRFFNGQISEETQGVLQGIRKTADYMRQNKGREIGRRRTRE